MPRFMLEGSGGAQSFVLRSYTIHELRNQHVCTSLFLNTEYTTIVFCALSKAKVNKNIQQGTLSGFITISHLKADLHGTTLSHTTSLRQAYDMNCFV